MKIRATLSTDPDPRRAAARAGEALAGEFADTGVDLAFLFTTAQHVPAARQIAAEVRRRLEPRRLAGTTAIGVVGAGQAVEGDPGVALLALHLPGVEVDVFRFSIHPRREKPRGKPGYAFSGFPDRIQDAAGRRALVILADPFTTPVKELLEETDRTFPGLPVVGGLSSAGRAPGQNRLFVDGEVGHVGAVGVLLSGGVCVDTVVSQGCRPLGRSYLITRAEGNRIRSLGRRPALTRLQEVFEGAGADERRLLSKALHVGIAMNEYQDAFTRGDFLIRNVLGVDPENGAIAISGVPRVGQTMQFHVCDVATAQEDYRSMMEAQKNAERSYAGALIFTCNGRGRRFFGQPDHDVSEMERQIGPVPAVGFFAAGEIGPVRGRTFVHGYTASVCLLRAPEAATADERG